MAKTRRVQIGVVGIDAGMLYLGDPCYIAHTPLGRTGGDGHDDTAWREFLRGIRTPGEDYMVSHATVLGTTPNGHTFPAGVVCISGAGDGEYPVYAEITEDGLIARVTVDFKL